MATSTEALARFMTRLVAAAQELASELQAGDSSEAPEEGGPPSELGKGLEAVYPGSAEGLLDGPPSDLDAGQEAVYPGSAEALT